MESPPSLDVQHPLLAPFLHFLRLGRKMITFLLPLVFFTLVLSLLITFASDQAVMKSASKRHSSNVDALPDCQVVLLLGCSEYLGNGRRNLYFKYRIEAAVDLYRANSDRIFLVSGDNGHKNYNEPEAMKSALIREGVPEDKIVCDYAGFRTLDSVVRAREIFGVERLIVVSQQFHNERAIFLAQAKNIQAYGYNARDIRSRGGLKTRIREKLARVKTMLDVSILNTQPRFLGKKIRIT